MQAAIQLLGALKVRVIPERPGVSGLEVVMKGFPGVYRSLSQLWHPVHTVRHPHAVPVDGGRSIQAIFQYGFYPLPDL